jgi:hypothetical protein
MKSHRPQKKNQESDGLPEGQPSPPRRFRIVKLEERIAPKKAGGNTKKQCVSVVTCDVGCFESEHCW